MLVIIPNPNQIAELVRVQKAFIKNANSPAGESSPARPGTPVFYQHTPLWIFVEPGSSDFSRDFNKEELKGLSAGITKVEIAPPYVYFSENLQQVVLGCQSIISTTSGSLQGEFILCNSVSSQAGAKVVNHTPTSECAEPSLNLCYAKVLGGAEVSFPLQLKVFRLANAVRLDKHSMAVSDFVWKKITLP